MNTESQQGSRQVGGVMVSTLRRLDGWPEACEKLDALYAIHGDAANQEARGYADVYQGRRAAMVFDVVYSRTRRYQARVLPQVDAFSQEEAARSLSTLTQRGTGSIRGLRQREEQTMQEVAAALLRSGEDAGLDDDDEICQHWARYSDVGMAYGLDPYLGKIRGIGLALFHYLRMRCGADTLKPDRRVGAALERFGFPVKTTSQDQIYAVGMGAAADCGISPLVLDQLLWWSSE